jgi:hypothetical protein
MFRFLLGVFLILHGLVHLWFVILSLGLVQVKPGMADLGWTGKSWLFTGMLGEANAKFLAALLFALAALALLGGGIGFLLRAEWWWEVVLSASIFSAVVLLATWDGSAKLLVEKGVIGLIISLVLLVVLTFFRRQALAF